VLIGLISRAIPSGYRFPADGQGCAAEDVGAWESLGKPLHGPQILLKPGQYAAWTEIARLERRSLSDLMRRNVQKEIVHRAGVTPHPGDKSVR
jgi:hypothetical protein